MLRLAHTLKGAAHVVKQAEIAGMAHQLEDLLVALSVRRCAFLASRPRPCLAWWTAWPRSWRRWARKPSAAGRAARPGSARGNFRYAPGRSWRHGCAIGRGWRKAACGWLGLKTKLAAVEHAADLAALLLSHLSAPAADAGSERAAASLRKGRAIAEDLQTVLSAVVAQPGLRRGTGGARTGAGSGHGEPACAWSPPVPSLLPCGARCATPRRRWASRWIL